MRLTASAFIITALSAFIIAACGDKKEAQPKNEPAPTATASKPSSPEPSEAKSLSGRIALSPENTKIGFVGAKVIGSHEGVFEQFTGTVDYKNGDPTGASVSVEIQLDSVKTDDPKLDGHLKSPDFFDVAKYPKATFQSTEVGCGRQRRRDAHRSWRARSARCEKSSGDSGAHPAFERQSGRIR